MNVEVCCGSISEVSGHVREVRSTPKSGHRQLDRPCLKSADFVAKVS
jgi:hypothetical protein